MVYLREVIEREESVRETDDQKLDRLTRQVQELNSNFERLLMELKHPGFSNHTESYLNPSKETEAKGERALGFFEGNQDIHPPPNVSCKNQKIIQPPSHEGRIESLEGTLVNAAGMVSIEKGLLHRPNTLKEEVDDNKPGTGLRSSQS